MHTLLVHRHDCRLCGTTLKASDRLAEEDMATLKVGKDFTAEVKQPRSLQHHRLFFALLRKVAKSTPTPLDEQALLSWIKVRTGHVTFLPLGFGQAYEAPASIAWHQMDQAQFRDFFDRAVQLILTDIAPALPPSFASEFLAMLDAPSERLDAPRPPAGVEAAAPPPRPATPAAAAALHPLVVLAEDLSGAPLERVLAWSDLFEATLRACRRDRVSARRYWSAARDCGRLAVVHRLAPQRFAELNAVAAELASQMTQAAA